MGIQINVENRSLRKYTKHCSKTDSNNSKLSENFLEKHKKVLKLFDYSVLDKELKNHLDLESNRGKMNPKKI
jgi:hypothetical protein